MSNNAMLKIVAVFPRVLILVAFAGLAIGLFLRRGDTPSWRSLLEMAAIVVYLSWLIAELRVTLQHDGQTVTETGTLIPYGSARIATAVSAAIIGPTFSPETLAWVIASAAVFVTGIAVRLLAVRQLGRFYSHHVRRTHDHSVVSTGPYALVRHPAYCGMIVSHVGFVCLFANPASILCLLLLTDAIVWRINVEEQMLFEIPGYPSYAANRPRLLPGVW